MCHLNCPDSLSFVRCNSNTWRKGQQTIEAQSPVLTLGCSWTQSPAWAAPTTASGHASYTPSTSTWAHRQAPQISMLVLHSRQECTSRGCICRESHHKAQWRQPAGKMIPIKQEAEQSNDAKYAESRRKAQWRQPAASGTKYCLCNCDRKTPLEKLYCMARTHAAYCIEQKYGTQGKVK